MILREIHHRVHHWETSSDPSSDDLSDSSSDHSLPTPSSSMRPSHHLCSLVLSIPRLSAAISDRPSHDSSSASPSRMRISHAHICWNLESFDDVSSSNLHNIMPPRMRTRSAGRATAAESLGGGTGVRVGRGGRGLVPDLVTPKSRMIERYVYDLAPQIRRMVAATKPKTIQKAVHISGALIDEAVRNG
ncbi:hypothetical protein Tco_1210328 [Tanacetum coccineum]